MHMRSSSMRRSVALVFLLASTTCHPAGLREPEPARDGAAAERASAIPTARDAPALAAVRDSLAWLVDTIVIRRPDYRLLLHALSRYRGLAADSTIPAFPTPAALPVRPGDTFAAVPELRVRLLALGDLDTAGGLDTGSVYAGPVVDAVRRFQRRHGLEDDGIIGRETLAQLQTPLAVRVREIERSLEQFRREPPMGSGPFIVVNVPAFQLFAFDGTGEDTAAALAMKVIVGRADRMSTPVLVEQLRYLDFWPEWNVPRSILVKEIIPKLGGDPWYLRRQDMELVGAGEMALGDSVTPSVIEALRVGALRVRQRRGPANPLGRVKFVIPNDSNIYLHDTPFGELFERSRRDFSHGCIRVEHARDLAIWVMRDGTGWNADSVDAAMETPLFRRVMIPHPMRVIVEYNTAMATAGGVVWFVPDIYGRDRDTINR